MKVHTFLMAGVAAIALATGVGRAQEVKDVNVLHWLTSGGEAAAISVVQKDVGVRGFTWKDVPIAGGGGDAAMTALKAMVAAGNPPDASQMLGYTVLDYAAAGQTADMNELAAAEGWDAVVPDAIKKFAKHDGTWAAAPMHVHASNWIWVNKAAMDKLGAAEPATLDELFALMDKAKAAGITPLALGGQDWQEAVLFDSIVASTGGPEFFTKAFGELDEGALRSDTMKAAFDNLKRFVSYADPNFSGRDWNLATAMVINEEALLQPIGDWAKGEFNAAGKVAGQDYLCVRFPGTAGSVIYLADFFGMMAVPEDHKAAQQALAASIMSKEVQVDFSVVKGSVPARTDISDEKFDACGKKAIADFKSAADQGTLVGSLAFPLSAPPAVSNAYKDVVTKFVHGQIQTSEEAVEQLVSAIDDVR